MNSNYWGRTKPPAGVALDLSHPLADGLVFYSGMTAGYGRRAEDLISGNHGTFNSTVVTWDGSPSGRVVSCPTAGASNYIGMPVSNAYKPILPVTFACRIMVLSVAANQGWMHNDGAASNQTGVALLSTSSGAIQIQYGDDAGGVAANTRLKITANSVIVANQWYTVVAVIRAQTNMSIYIDGKDAGGTYSGSSAATDPVYTANAGRLLSRSAGPVTFSGKLEWSGIWNRELSPQEVKALTAQPYQMFAPPVWRKIWIPPAAGGGVTGTGAVVIQKPDLSGSGTFADAPGVTGTAAVVIGAPQLSGSGTFTAAPSVTGTGAVLLGPPGLSGSGTFADAPSVTGTATVLIGAPSLSGSGTSTDPGTISGSGAVTIGTPALSGAGTFTAAPGVSGSGPLTIGAPVLSGAGTFSGLSAVTGTGAITIGAPSLSGTDATGQYSASFTLVVAPSGSFTLVPPPNASFTRRT